MTDQLSADYSSPSETSGELAKVLTRDIVIQSCIETSSSPELIRIAAHQLVDKALDIMMPAAIKE